MKRTTIVVVLLWSVLTCGETSISASEARNHVGQRAIVCGQVAGSHYAARSRGNPTFINLDRAYPNQIFTIVIWGSDRAKFGDPEDMYSGKQICVTGTITLYRGGAETTANEPSQIKIQ
jgi:hypothetical protein